MYRFHQQWNDFSKCKKGINFRDGHSCNSRCAPSRYCLLTGRNNYRKHYHYKPMDIEFGRKVLPHLFKRNNYETIGVGKIQPLDGGNGLGETETPGEYFFTLGAKFNGFDKSFTSRSYCCSPGGGYFVNDVARAPFNKWSILMNFRSEDESSILISEVDQEAFWKNQDHWHLLDGYSEGTDANKQILRALTVCKLQIIP